MTITFNCPSCQSAMTAADGSAAKLVQCPKCKRPATVPGKQTAVTTARPATPERIPTLMPADEWQPVDDESENGPILVTSDPRKLRRELSFIQLRQRVRGLCGKVLGPSAGERLVCALTVAIIPFALSFGVSIAFQQPALFAALQGVGAFLIVAVVCSLLVTIGGSDEALEERRVRLVEKIPAVQAALRQREERRQIAFEAAEDRARAQYRADDAAERRRNARRRCPHCAETILAEARKCKHCGEKLEPAKNRELIEAEEPERERRGPSVVHHHHHQQRSGGVAAVLELLFGLFLGTFGIGHIYAGNVGLGMFILFGWWIFVGVNVAASFATCGAWGFVAMFLIPACWFLMLIVSPLLAASSVQN
jgi:outer membrane murein-binding lipoprotein Lpp/DNA-directed RNA polymerase subunit M/transcription elongation factor TFIIS